jgi:hypothetical protein
MPKFVLQGAALVVPWKLQVMPPASFTALSHFSASSAKSEMAVTL